MLVNEFILYAFGPVKRTELAWRIQASLFDGRLKRLVGAFR
jgi:hypothetical protein